MNNIEHTHVQAFNNMYGLHPPSINMNLLNSPKQYMEFFVFFPSVDSNKFAKNLTKFPKTFKLGQQLTKANEKTTSIVLIEVAK